MLTDLLLAAKNVMRHRRRSAFALAAIGFGVAALMLASGFIAWNFQYYREAMIASQLGHLRVHRAGYTENGVADPYAYLLSDNTPAMAAIASLRGVRMLSARLSLAGLASHGEATLPFIAEGVNPATETQLTRSLTMTAGEALSADDGAGVILGQGLAGNLGVRVGDPLVLLVNTGGGGINAMDARVRGIFTTISKAYDDTALRLPLASARKLMRVSGAHTWMVWLDDTAATADRLDDIKRITAAGSYEVVPWWQLSDFYNKSADLFAKQVGVMKVIIGLLIVLSISNTMTMGVMERTGEIGTAMALGDTRARLLRRFLAEALVLGTLGALLGILVGYGLATIISIIGIPVPAPPGMGHGYTGRILVTPVIAAGAVLLAVATTFVAGVYPAWRASRMVIVDALRRNRA
ncbi:MAG: FtsX-like permease family protein [Betaproteobacteria bacterium]